MPFGYSPQRRVMALKQVSHAKIEAAGYVADSGSPTYASIPDGGTTGQALVKTSGTDYDLEWDSITRTASTTVSSEITFGISANAGSSTTYSKGDHTHGTPPVGWEDLRFPAVSTKLGGTNDPTFLVFKTNGTGSQGVFVYWFSKTVEQELYFACQLPHSYQEGTGIYPHVHWVPKTNGASGALVSWGLEYTWANMSTTYGDSTIIYANSHIVNDAVLVAGRHYLSSFATISGTGKTISSMLICRVFRDATGAGLTDDYDDEAGLLEIDFHYKLDTVGSSSEESK